MQREVGGKGDDRCQKKKKAGRTRKTMSGRISQSIPLKSKSWGRERNGEKGGGAQPKTLRFTKNKQKKMRITGKKTVVGQYNAEKSK